MPCGPFMAARLQPMTKTIVKPARNDIARKDVETREMGRLAFEGSLIAAVSLPPSSAASVQMSTSAGGLRRLCW